MAGNLSGTVYGFALVTGEIATFYREIATPVCGLVRNDMVDDGRVRRFLLLS